MYNSILKDIRYQLNMYYIEYMYVYIIYIIFFEYFIMNLKRHHLLTAISITFFQTLLLRTEAR